MATDQVRPTDADPALAEILAEWLRYVETANHPDPQVFQARYPAHSEELASALDDWKCFHQWAELPLRPSLGDAAVKRALGDSPLVARFGGLDSTQLGDYELLEELGRGGMAVVYKARHRTLGRVVAIKILTQFGLSDVERFRIEASAAAGLDHPHVVPIYEVGKAWSDVAACEIPYFTMRLIEGGTLSQALASNSWRYDDVCCQRRAASLVAFVADAVHHAHQRGILHRDLKPSNVLLEPRVTRPVGDRPSEPGTDCARALDWTPFVTDFGLAKMLDGDSELTQPGLLLGTPSFMAPEQLERHGQALTIATDVFGLGAVLYSLLTKQPPFRHQSLLGTIEQVRLCDPVSPHRINPQVSRDLETICMKCLAKDPERRYTSALAVADDLRRWLADEPIAARSASVWEKSRAWGRRHPRAVAMAMLICLGLMASVAAILWHNRQLGTALAMANQRQAEILQRDSEFRLQLYATDMSLAASALQNGDARRLHALLKQQEPASGEPDLRGFEYYLFRSYLDTQLRTLAATNAPILSLDLSPDERLIACSDRAGYLHVWELSSGRLLQVIRASERELTCVRFSPDGLLLATASQDQTIALWDVATWKQRARFTAHDRTITSVVWSPDANYLASAGRDNLVKIWEIEHQVPVATLSDHQDVVRCVVWSPDGKTLASAGSDRDVRLWWTDTWSPRAVLRGHDAGIIALAFSPDGDTIASGGYGSHLLLHDVASGRETMRIPSLRHIWSLDYHPDGTAIVEGWNDGRLRLVRPAANQDEVELPILALGHRGDVRAGRFSRSGRLLVTASQEDQEVRVWDVSRLEGYRSLSLPGDCVAIDVGRDRAIVNWRRQCLQYSLSNTTEPRLIADWVDRVVVADGTAREQVLAMCSGSRIQLLESDSMSARHQLQGPDGDLINIVLSPQGTYLAACNAAGMGWIWNTVTGAIETTLHGLPPEGALSFSPDDRLLATSDEAGPAVFLWHVQTGERVGRLTASQPVGSLAFSPDSKLLAAGGGTHGLLVWDVEGDAQPDWLMGHDGPVPHVAFSPDGRTLASTGFDGTTRLWHVATRREMCTLHHSTNRPKWLHFDSNTRLLVAAQPYGHESSQVLVFDASR